MIRNLCIRGGAVALAAGLLSACHRDDAPVRAMRGLVLGTPVTIVATVPTRLPRALGEMSGAAMSTTQPGVFFTINDSGNEPLLFALDTAGAPRGAWRIDGTNIDWEAVSVGPCAPAGPPRCVYVGDVGDNTASHANRTIYRLAEPRARPAGAAAPDGRVAGPRLDAERVVFTYPDGPHDVEAMYAAPNGDVLLITKRALHASVRLRQALVFRIPAAAWAEHRPRVAQLVDSLPIVPGSAPFRTITDAALAEDGKQLAVRTYTQVFVFATDSVSGLVNRTAAPRTCDVTGADEQQGEGVAWVHADGPLLLTSEGRGAPLHLVRCH